MDDDVKVLTWEGRLPCLFSFLSNQRQEKGYYCEGTVEALSHSSKLDLSARM